MKFKKLVILFLGLLLGFALHWWMSGFFLVVRNYGISLSIDLPYLILFDFVFVFLIARWYWKSSSLVLILVLIGGVVNLVDRLVFGYVRDYWNLGGILVNNLNDWLIGMGVLLFFVGSIYGRRKDNF